MRLFCNALLLLHNISAAICYALPLEYALYKHLCFCPQLTMILLILLGSIYSCIQLYLLKSVGNRRHICPPPPLTSMIIRTMESVIIRAPRVQSYWRTFNVDHLITFGILSHHLTKLAFIEQESHIDARYVERSNVFASHNVRFRSCMFYTNMFICDYFRNSWLSKSTFVGRTNILLLLFVRQ